MLFLHVEEEEKMQVTFRTHHQQEKPQLKQFTALFSFASWKCIVYFFMILESDTLQQYILESFDSYCLPVQLVLQFISYAEWLRHNIYKYGFDYKDTAVLIPLLIHTL